MSGRWQVTNSVDERAQPSRIGRIAKLDEACVTTGPVLAATASRAGDYPVAVDQAKQLLAEHLQTVVARCFEDSGSDLENDEAGVAIRLVDLAHVFYSDTLDQRDLGEQAVQENAVWQADNQFVDGTSAATLKDLDTHDISARSTNMGCHLTQCARSVRKPHSDDNGAHSDNLASARSVRFATL